MGNHECSQFNKAAKTSTQEAAAGAEIPSTTGAKTHCRLSHSHGSPARPRELIRALSR